MALIASIFEYHPAAKNDAVVGDAASLNLFSLAFPCPQHLEAGSHGERKGGGDEEEVSPPA